MATHLMGRNYEKALSDHNCDPTKKPFQHISFRSGPEAKRTDVQTDRVTDNLVPAFPKAELIVESRSFLLFFDVYDLVKTRGTRFGAIAPV